MNTSSLQSHYVLKNGKYAFVSGNRCLFVTEEVSILFDSFDMAVHKHGTPFLVQAEFKNMHKTYGRAKGLEDIADNLRVITGKFDIDELNKAISTADYMETFSTSLETAALEQADQAIRNIMARSSPSM